MRAASTCTLVTSGQVASITRRSRAWAAARTAGETPCALKTSSEPLGTSAGVVDEDGALGAQLFDDVAVVDDLVADVDGRAVALEREIHDLDGAVHAGAEAAGIGEQHAHRRELSARIRGLAAEPAAAQRGRPCRP